MQKFGENTILLSVSCGGMIYDDDDDDDVDDCFFLGDGWGGDGVGVVPCPTVTNCGKYLVVYIVIYCV